MINKRLLIKNLLAHHDENVFYDKKRQLNLHTREGKAKFLKHICALANTNPLNNSYLVVGVEDQDNAMVGEDFFDDSRIQNLVNAFLENPPKIQYENIPFPNLPKDKVIGLVTIKPNAHPSFFKKGIHTVPNGAMFFRQGSNTLPVLHKEQLHRALESQHTNTQTVTAIENQSHNSIADTLHGVIDFIHYRHKDMSAQFHVFKDLFVVCWAGHPKKFRQQTLYSRVDVELINEQVKLFYSNLDEVALNYDENSFSITEYVPLGLNDKTTYYPLEKITLNFYENGFYDMHSEMLFSPPQYNLKMLQHIYNSNRNVLEKLQKSLPLSAKELKELENLPATFLICHLNGFSKAKSELIDAKPLLKNQANPMVYVAFKEVMRIMRKIKYGKNNE